MNEHLPSEKERNGDEPDQPFLHGIPHVTCDSSFYIYYKTARIAHFDRDYVDTECAKRQLLELARRCDFLESIGERVSYGTAVKKWQQFNDEYANRHLNELDALLNNNTGSLLYSQVTLYNSGREYSYFTCGNPGLEEIKNHPVTQGMVGRYYDDVYKITVKPFLYGDNEHDEPLPVGEINNRPEAESLLVSCHDYLLTQDKATALQEQKFTTDFAKRYEAIKQLDGLLNKPGRSLRYSEITLYDMNIDMKTFFINSVPSFDEIKEHAGYKDFTDRYGNELTVTMSTFQYGDGELLTPEEMPDSAAVAEAIGKAHGGLQYLHLTHQTAYQNFTQQLEMEPDSRQAEPETGIDEGYEP
jgi:hypothetical protein